MDERSTAIRCLFAMGRVRKKTIGCTFTSCSPQTITATRCCLSWRVCRHRCMTRRCACRPYAENLTGDHLLTQVSAFLETVEAILPSSKEPAAKQA